MEMRLIVLEGNKLIMQKGPNFEVDFLVACIGIDLNTELAKEAGLSIGPTKGIVVNDYMQTDDPDIYAIGDAVESKDWFTGKPKNVKLAWHAHRQSAIVASHLAGIPVRDERPPRDVHYKAVFINGWDDGTFCAEPKRRRYQFRYCRL